MASQPEDCRWGWCAGCGRERRLARAGGVMRPHRRWDPATAAMVWCEGSARPPFPVVRPVLAPAQPEGRRAGSGQAGPLRGSA